MENSKSAPNTTVEVQMDSLNSSQNFVRPGAASPGADVELKKPQKPVYKSKVFIIAIIFSSTLFVTMLIGFILHYTLPHEESRSGKVEYLVGDLPEEQQVWYDKGAEELRFAVNRNMNKLRAKNVILFVGDGMGPNTVTAARLLGFREEGLMTWERFPHMGMLKTYCANKQVPDSFSTATALFSGVKVNYETGGVDSSVPLGNCTASLDPSRHVESILKWAQDDGMRTGFVTTTRVTHATPAALYAHVPDRRWECEDKMTAEQKAASCKDIARQLIEDDTGKKINVIMGGGRQMLVSNVPNSEADPVDTWSCYSKDGRNLIQTWRDTKAAEQASHAVVQNLGELQALNGNVDHVLGIFANGHLKYDHELTNANTDMPTLTNMTLKAIEVLKRQNKGFLLVVEGGMIDQAHHRGTARKALSETLALNDAIQATVEAMQDSLDETLIIVTADHAHSLTINGHAAKGANVLGMAGNSKTEGTPYTILTYGTSFNGFQVGANGNRVDPSLVDTTDYEYTQQAAINTDENLHGGSDVTVHATGPMSYLFCCVHEQSYVAHAISYALRIGRFRDSAIVESIAEFV